MHTPQKARKFYNELPQYESFQISEGWQIPALLIMDLLPYLSGKETVADVGCGPGLIGVELEKSKWTGKLVGMDIAEKRLMEAIRKSSYTFCVQVDAHNLPFIENSFDVVVSSAMVGLTGVGSVQEMLRVLKPGGFLACVAGEIKSKRWCRKRFQETVGYFKEISNVRVLAHKDLGSGSTNDYDDEHYVYYLLRKN